MATLAATAVAHRVGTAGYRRVTAALAGAGLASFSAMYCTQALLPAFSVYYRIAPTTAALTVSLTTGLMALAIIPASVLSERYGRTRVMLTSGVASSVIGLLLPFSPNLGVLLTGRAAQGVALAGIPAVAMAYLAEEIHVSSLGSAVGRYIAGNTVGGLAGRIIPSLVVEVSNWRVALLVSSAASLLGVIVFAALVPRSQFFTPKAATARDAVRNLAAHLRNPLLAKLFCLSFVLMGGFVTVYNYLAYRLTGQSFGLASSTVGLMFLLYLAGTVSSNVAGRLADRKGRALVLFGALPVTAAGLLVTVPHALVAIFGGIGLFTAGFFAAHTVASGWVGAAAKRDRAVASAMYLFAYYLGGSVVGAFGGVVYNVGGWPATVTFVGSLLLVALCLVATLIRDAVPVGRPHPA